MKQSASELTLATHWTLRRSPKIPELRKRLLFSLEQNDTLQIVFSSPIDWEEAVKRIRGTSELPFQKQLEEELKADISMIRCFFDSKMLLSLRQSWLVQGHRIYFKDQEPSYETVYQAVSELLLRQPLWEK